MRTRVQIQIYTDQIIQKPSGFYAGFYKKYEDTLHNLRSWIYQSCSPVKKLTQSQE